jgi:hypothetical protein
MYQNLNLPNKKMKKDQISIGNYVRAYPDYIKDSTSDTICWKDGTVMPFHQSSNTSRSYKEKLDNPSLYDQISSAYVKSSLRVGNPIKNNDPGRFRYMPLFYKMYGSTEEEVSNNLVEIEWLPKHLQKETVKNEKEEKCKIQVTTVNNVSRILTDISNTLDDLVDDSEEKYLKYLINPGGTFCWRTIAGSKRQSAHSFGMTIDINVEHSHYWLWDYKSDLSLPKEIEIDETEVNDELFPAYRNDIPLEIVSIFEDNNFIWGGNWYHYDTMHFEYRPELFLDNL